MKHEGLIEEVIAQIKKARNPEVYFNEFYTSPDAEGNNEFLMFIKPEITIENSNVKLDEILKMIFSKIEEFGLNIKNIQALSAAYLKQYNIIAQHYGVINKISGNALENLSDDAKENFKSIYNKNINEAKVLGSLEFINEYNHFSPTALDHLWQNSGFKKLAGGTYSAQLTIDGEEVYLINGFHPRQLEHFIASGKCIITLTLTGDTNWEAARGEFIGSTNPASAKKGSIRNVLLENCSTYGLQAVTASWNGVHLSAGPVEGLVELIRYNSNFASSQKKSYTDFEFGRILESNFSSEKVENILNNANAIVDGKTISVFDLTEEKNSNEALQLLKKI